MPGMKDAAAKPGMKFTRGVGVSVVLHLVLAAVFLLKLPLPQTDAAKEEAVSVELVEPPKPPEPEKKQEPEEKKARMPAPKQQSTPPAPPPPTSAGAPPPPQEQAFEAGTQDEAKDEPEASAPSAVADGKAATAPKPAEQAEAAKPAPKPALTPAAIDMLRAKMQAAKAEKAKEEAKAEPPKPEPAEKPPEETKPEEKPAQEMARAEGEPDKPKGKDAAAKVELEQMTEAKTHYSKKMLSDPRVKQALGQLPPERRIVQICSIEALEQVRHARPEAFPDLLVPFSTGGGLISDHVLDAKGGAFRTQDGWFDIAYRCQVDAETTRIASFRYEIGGAVPRSDWARRKLPAD